MGMGEELQAILGAGQDLERQMQQVGLVLAKVTNITDEEKLNRVKCMPIGNEQAEETDWCYVMAPLVGKSCGQFFFPNVNDLVVLAYLSGDPHRPMVIGGFWNTELPPPYTIENGKVYNFSIKTPNGTELLFYDEPKKQKVTLTLPSGTVLCIDDEAQAVSLKDGKGENALEMNLKGGTIALKAKKQLDLSAGETKITLESGGSLTMAAQKEISMEAAEIAGKGNSKVAVDGAEVKVNATGQLELSASGTAALKGATVSIN